MTEQRLINVAPLMTNGWHLVQTGESNRFIRSMSLADVPVVEAREVVHAKWEKHKCTNCGKTEPGYYDHVEDCIVYTPSAYCPSCGAKMWR